MHANYIVNKGKANPNEIFTLIEKVRKKGYSLNEAETFDYVYGIGAPIMDSQKRAIAGISISGTKGSINVKTVEDLAYRVTDTAKMISKKLIEN